MYKTGLIRQFTNFNRLKCVLSAPDSINSLTSKGFDRSFHLNRPFLSKWSKKANKDNK